MWWSRAAVAAAVMSGAVAVSAGGAVAEPAPRPPAGQGAAQKPAGHARHHHRPRTVVRCQNDETDQIDEFGDDEPRHSFTPADGGGRCSGDALGIAQSLAGEHPRSHRARPVR